MRKRLIIVSVLIVICLALACVLIYRYYSPTNSNKDNTKSLAVTQTLGYKESIQYVNSNSGNYVLFINEANNDADYIVTSFLEPFTKIDVNVLPQIISVNINDHADLTVTQLRDRYKIERTPAFVYLKSDGAGNVQIISTITYYSEAPFTQDELKTWFFQNGLWNAPYDKK